MFIFSEVLYKKPTLKILDFLHYIYKQLYKLSHIMRKSVFVTCEQQRCRSACVSAQSDQCLCCSLLRRYNIVYTSYIQNFKTLVRPLAQQSGLSLTWSQTPKTGFLVTRLKLGVRTKALSDIIFPPMKYGMKGHLPIFTKVSSQQC